MVYHICTIVIIIIIIIITRPKPAYGRQGLANISLRASGAQLRSDEVIDKHTLYHNIYIIIRDAFKNYLADFFR